MGFYCSLETQNRSPEFQWRSPPTMELVGGPEEALDAAMCETLLAIYFMCFYELNGFEPGYPTQICPRIWIEHTTCYAHLDIVCTNINSAYEHLCASIGNLDSIYILCIYLIYKTHCLFFSQYILNVVTMVFMMLLMGQMLLLHGL